MQIIDFEKKGNVVKFYLADESCVDYWGDDWDDAPYEHNAGTVYDHYVNGVKEIAFPMDYDVYEPADDWHYHHNSPFCKEDFKNRKAPCIVALKRDKDDWRDYLYTEMVFDSRALKFYYGDKMESGEMEIWKQ